VLQLIGRGASAFIPALLVLALVVGAFAASRYNDGATAFVQCAPLHTVHFVYPGLSD